MHPFRPYDEIDKIDRDIPVEVVPRGARKQIFMTSDPSTDDVVNALRDVFTESLQGRNSSFKIDTRLRTYVTRCPSIYVLGRVCFLLHIVRACLSSTKPLKT